MNARLLGVGTTAAGTLVAFVSSRVALSERARADVAIRLACWALFVVGVLFVLLGLMYSAYAFSPDAGR